MLDSIPQDILNEIVYQISELYVRNEPADELIKRFHGHIPLNDFLCFTYGNTKLRPGRTIEVLYFLAKGHVGNQVPYEIALLNQDTNEYNTFWVENTGVLRKDFLRFTKKTHLFRNTFLYDPVTKKIYRLHELKPFLHLPNKKVVGQVVWTSATQHTLIKENPQEDYFEDTCIVPAMSKYKQIIEMCELLQKLIESCK